MISMMYDCIKPCYDAPLYLSAARIRHRCHLIAAAAAAGRAGASVLLDVAVLVQL